VAANKHERIALEDFNIANTSGKIMMMPRMRGLRSPLATPHGRTADGGFRLKRQKPPARKDVPAIPYHRQELRKMQLFRTLRDQ
jgi:hypothetical protein